MSQTQGQAAVDPAEPGAPPMRTTVAWIVYDLANTLFSFVVLSFYFGPWLSDDLGTRDSAVTVTQSVAMAVVLVLAPFLGAISDRSRRMPFLISFTIVAVVFTMLLGVGDLLGLGVGATTGLAIVTFALANIGYQLALVFYDALLPFVATPQRMGRIGAWGVGIGYIGSFVGLGLGTFILGANDAAEPWLFVATGAMFLLFALPCFFFVREPRRAPVGGAGIRATSREVVARIRLLPKTPLLGRFLVARILYADAVNTLLLILGIFAVREAGFETATLRYSLLLGLGIVFAVPAAPLWGILVDRAGSKHTLSLVLLVWALTLTVVAIHPVLGLSQNVFFVYGALVGIGLAGVWSADRPLLVELAPRGEVGAWFGMYALAGRFAAIIGPLLWSLTVDVVFDGHPRARTFGVLVLLVQILAAWLVLRRLPDPRKPGRGPLARIAPWGDGTGLPRLRWMQLPLRVPFVLLYLVVSWVLFIHLAEPGAGIRSIPKNILGDWVYAIPDLTQRPIMVYFTLVSAPLLNHDQIQLVYVTVLLLLFGLPFEMKEGTKRFAAIFAGTTFVGAVFAGFLLHVIYPEMSDHEVFRQAWERTWSGGSVGAFGVMGALAARARTPWPLFAFFVFWELNVGWWYLRSYTPAFHLTALLVGFLYTRWRLPPIPAEHAGPEGVESSPSD